MPQYVNTPSQGYIGGRSGEVRSQPPFFKGYILLETTTGKFYKYVRNQVKPAIGVTDPRLCGDTGNYYVWGDTRCGWGMAINGDSYVNTGDTSGRLKFDFERTTQLWQQQLGGGISALMKFPELGGDTATLVRKNKDQPLSPITGNIPGDTTSYSFYKLTPYTRMRITAFSIISITAVEERVPAWYQPMPKGYSNI
jgi:hypothetical protein